MGKESPEDVDAGHYFEAVGQRFGVVVDSSSTGFNHFNSARGVVIPGKEVSFYPYVQMAYDQFNSTEDTAGFETKTVNVLAQHPSTIQLFDYVEVGWLRENLDSVYKSMKVSSNMWTVSKRAVDKWGAKKVLPGGALYKVETDARTDVGVVVWDSFLPDIALRALPAQQPVKLSDSKTKTREIIADVRKSLDGLDVVQWVDPDCRADNAFGKNEDAHEVNPGSGNTLYNRSTLLNRLKHNLKRGGKTAAGRTAADLDILGESYRQTIYTVSSDVAGKVVVTSKYRDKNGANWGNWGTVSVIQSIDATQGIGNFTNMEVVELDDYLWKVFNYGKLEERIGYISRFFPDLAFHSYLLNSELL
ncbi:hypothetical protein M1N64_05010 [Peptococcaceae bacterium]|nr:hypothetical protein [Peptococcaceae bacterium]